MKGHEIRQRFRTLLADEDTHVLPVVFDGISARVTEMTGFEVALVSGNVSAAALLALPDIGLVTLTEMTDFVRRICKATDIGYLVDADNGYGNAINVMRCVSEFESAGAAAIMFEDTELPTRYGQSGTTFVSREEMCGKLQAAVEAREDDALVLVGRTDTLRPLGLEEAVARVRAYSTIGVDAIFVPGARSREDFAALRAATHLPLIGVGLPKPDAETTALAFLRECGVGMTVTSTVPFQVSVQAIHDALVHLRKTGEFGPFEAQMCSRQLLDELLGATSYQDRQRRFLGLD